MEERKLELLFQNSQKFYSRGKYRKTLEELSSCSILIKIDLAKIEKLPADEAIFLIKKFSEINYLKIQCLNKLGNECCALKNTRFIYGQLRSLFLNPKLSGYLRTLLRNELLKITQLYQSIENIHGCDNLLEDFNRIYYTKILL